MNANVERSFCAAIPLARERIHVRDFKEKRVNMNTIQIRQATLSYALVLSLAACGGGGGGSTPPPGPSIANTAAPQYLPLSAGNTWTFSGGGSLRDTGSVSLQCGGCKIQGTRAEIIGLYSASGTLTGTLYIEKGVYTTGTYAGHAMTYFTGISNDGGLTVIVGDYSLDGKITGDVVMDDTPSAGEVTSFAPGTGVTTNPAVSTITSVGGTEPFGTNQIVNSIATSTLASGSTTLGFGFARGVGFTSISTSGSTLTVSSFSINAATAYSAARQPMRVQLTSVRQGTSAEMQSALASAIARMQ